MSLYILRFLHLVSLYKILRDLVQEKALESRRFAKINGQISLYGKKRELVQAFLKNNLAGMRVFLYSENDGGLWQENQEKSLVSCTKMHIFLYGETDEISDIPNLKM